MFPGEVTRDGFGLLAALCINDGKMDARPRKRMTEFAAPVHHYHRLPARLSLRDPCEPPENSLRPPETWAAHSALTATPRTRSSRAVSGRSTRKESLRATDRLGERGRAEIAERASNRHFYSPAARRTRESQRDRLEGTSPNATVWAVRAMGSQMEAESYDYIVTGAGLCRLCGGCAAFGDGAPPGAAARSRRARQLALDPHSRRLLPALHPRNLQLEVRERARCRPQRAHLLPAARQDARRDEFAQRHGLHARDGGRLRWLASARLCRLGLRKRSDLLPQGREPGAGRGRVPRRRRPAQCHRRTLQARDHRCDHRSGRAGRHSAQSRLQRRDAGRRRLLSGNGRQGAPMEQRDRLSEAGKRSPEPRGQAERACDTHRHRERPRRRRRVPHAPRHGDGAGPGAR